MTLLIALLVGCIFLFPRGRVSRFNNLQMASQARFDVPQGATAHVHIIDTTVRITDMPVNLVLTPEAKGFETFSPLASWSFLVESSSGQKVLFDLSIPPDINSYPPVLVGLFNKWGIKIQAQKHVAEILQEHGIDRSEITDVIWRY